MMFADWILFGVEWGVKIFFGLFTFLVALGMLAGLTALIGGFMKAGGGEE